MEVTYNESTPLIKPQTCIVFKLNTQGPFGLHKTLNHSTRALAREEAHDLIKTKGPHQVGKIATWKFFSCKSDFLKPNRSQSPTKTGLRQGQPEDDRKTEKLERNKSKTVDGVQEKTIQTVEAEVQPC